MFDQLCRDYPVAIVIEETGQTGWFPIGTPEDLRQAEAMPKEFIAASSEVSAPTR